ncbi:Fe-S cluster assembly protein HesB [Aeromicrobium sp. A1-2]|uniref:HesB/IscA family protein n=1 Tax=Aeromicrobium sp. A1-2 TaxID=2107713 RepID=UPI000E48E478|nr:Fe-S cluster assembly protein HesB [Aeromicrobium sp. A1-2]AXT84965.1 Fe-S cluster assembly protein HesB [Aeromicrobium sp. A1-2]
MLTLTDNAADIVKKISEGVADPEQSGLRISEAEDGTEAGLTLAPVESPEPGDQVVDADGARVFLDKAAAELLGDKVLDAQVDPDGSVQFGLGQQA